MFVENLGSGFILGLGLIVAIGAQNIFVLQQGLKRSHVFTVCLTCALSDAVLISIGVWAFYLVEDTMTVTAPVLKIAGAAFLFFYGAFSLRRAIWPAASRGADDPGPSSWMAVFLTCLAFTWANPHVYLDTVGLLGTVSTQYESRIAFAAGAIAASFFFFFSLGYGARRLAHLFESQSAWRVLDALVAVIMWTLAFRLVFGN